MKDQEAEAIVAQKVQRKIEAAARQQQLQGAAAEQVDDEDDEEAPELVRG